MKDNKAMMYGAIVIVAILVFVGAAVAVSLLTAQPYEVSLHISGNNTAATIYPYQSTAFNIVVSNLGSRPVAGLPIAFYVNGAQKNYSTYSIPAHQSIELEEVYTYTEPGSYLFSAAADPGNVLRLANGSAARGSSLVGVAVPEIADVYSSMPNSNIIYTDTFTTSGTGLLSGSLMEQLYGVSAIRINGADNGILAKSYQDLYPYISVANGAYSVYSNGTVDYAAWLQGTLTPQYLIQVVSSFGKKFSQAGSPAGPVGFVALSNTVSMCTYYQAGWTKVIEIYNASDGSGCLGMAGVNYSAPESNAIVEALKATKIDNASAVSNQISSAGNPWEDFYYTNATVLGQTVEYSTNSVGASTLFQLSTPQSIFLSTIEKVRTNVSGISPACYGLYADVNGSNVCSVVLPTNAMEGNQSFGAVYSSFISSNYTATIYSLLDEQYLTLAHANAAELISRLGIGGPQVEWTSPFQSTCGFAGGFGCAFDSISNGTASVTITNLNYSSVRLDNITCEEDVGSVPMPLNVTLARGANATVSTECQTLPIPAFSAETDLMLNLGYTYNGRPMIVNGTLNVSNTGG